MNHQTAVPRWALCLRLAGAGLLATTGGIHLDLYLTGYRYIPTISTFFVLQVVSAFALAALVAVTGRRLVAIAGAGFAIATLGGYLLSLWVGLFGFQEIRTTAGIVAGVCELAAAFVLGVYAAMVAPQDASSLGARLDGARRLVVSVVAVAAIVFAVAVAQSPGASSGRTTTTTSGGSVTAVRVTIQNFAFHPANFSVTPGETIRVTNRDSVDHTFTATPGSNPKGPSTPETSLRARLHRSPRQPSPAPMPSTAAFTTS